ncbi:N-acetylmuramoyl-L-alanine amidase [Romboutsia lituseburensis]|uniref:N-acetylmuramoyl-L-alanine amidase n=1 Tax=Romboutsia lituseburensis TaxID=1537 RepID=UPI00215B6511|nr:N-acetylmuramoyl-L-alanine amidase [Romboutsia lituseburensis]MCR8745465.1 N-acetylmuramoyl-L-alanine amidase [Romboutsia lituseburensis]
MNIRKKLLGSILTISMITAMSILSNIALSYADNKTEVEFNSVIGKYNKKDLIVENAIAIKLDETLNLSQNPNWELSNNEIAKIDKNGIVKPLKEGTVFLSQKIGSKAHIIELYVFNEKTNYITKNAKAESSKGKHKVFIDPGHGGSDPGTVGSVKSEKQLNLDVAERVKSKLENQGIEVKMSRTSDVYLTLSERTDIANEYGADIFVSIHHNAAESESANGIETFYHPNKEAHKSLSSELQTSLIKETDARDRGVKSANYAVLRTSNMTSALVEGGFMTNTVEYSKLIDSQYQEKLAAGVANGIVKYLNGNMNSGDEDKNPEVPPVVTPPTVIDTGITTANTLNVRAGAGTSYNIIGSLLKGTKVEIVEKNIGDWYKIKYNDGIGFVSNSYVKLDSDTTDEPSIPEIENKFIDINYHWAKDAILKFAAKGYIGGYSDDTFRPENYITRAEFVKIVNGVFGLKQFNESKKLKFNDIKTSAWYYNDVCIGVEAGYINGYEDNTFRPNGKITRQEAASIVAKITKLVGDGKLDFVDNNKISPWARASVDALSDNKIMGGYEDNTFRPQNSITRAEAVSTLERIIR